MGDRGDEELGFPEPPEGLLTAPENRVLARMDDPEAVAAAIDDLAAAGFERDEIYVLCGAAGAERLDVSGRHHGLLGRVYRMVESMVGEEGTFLPEAEKHLAGGGLVMTVPADHEATGTVARILHDHGGHDLLHFGRGHWEHLGR